MGFPSHSILYQNQKSKEMYEKLRDYFGSFGSKTSKEETNFESFQIAPNINMTMEQRDWKLIVKFCKIVLKESKND